MAEKIIKGLTLTQPWASLVALGHKRVETRSWRTYYGGWLAIHAAKNFPPDARHLAAEERAFGRLSPRIPVSSIVAVVKLDGCRQTADVVSQISGLERRLGDYSPGRWAWFMSDLLALTEPIPCRGSLGLWTLPAEIKVQLQSLLAEREGVRDAPPSTGEPNG